MQHLTPVFDTLLLDCQLARFGDGGTPDVVHDAALAITDGVVCYAGPRAALPAAASARDVHRLGGAWVTPGLIDCHTHAVFAGDRADEFAQRLGGASYTDIARAGGGILGTVRKTRAASQDELVASTTRRLQQLAADGVTTVEIKSGYGLDLDTERRMLQAARLAAQAAGMRVHTTFLGLHAVPPELDRAAYLEQVIEHWLPILHAEGLIDAVDAFCESIAYSAAECERLFARAQALGVPVKLHADQLSDGGGATLVGNWRGLSADHVEYTSAEGVAALAAGGGVAVLLPAAFVMLGETRKPPVAALRAAGVPMAVATDLNPGTAPLLSLRLAAHLACSVFGLTVEEALAGITVQAARALGNAQGGRLVAGAVADLAVWRIAGLAELCYWMGGDLLIGRMLGGVWQRAPDPRSTHAP